MLSDTAPYTHFVFLSASIMWQINDLLPRMAASSTGCTRVCGTSHLIQRKTPLLLCSLRNSLSYRHRAVKA